MELSNNVRLAIGILFALVGVAIFVMSRGSRGFNQRRQAGALLLAGAALLIASGLGYLDL